MIKVGRHHRHGWDIHSSVHRPLSCRFFEFSGSKPSKPLYLKKNVLLDPHHPLDGFTGYILPWTPWNSVKITVMVYTYSAVFHVYITDIEVNDGHKFFQLSRSESGDFSGHMPPWNRTFCFLLNGLANVSGYLFYKGMVCVSGTLCHISGILKLIMADSQPFLFWSRWIFQRKSLPEAANFVL